MLDGNSHAPLPDRQGPLGLSEPRKVGTYERVGLPGPPTGGGGVNTAPALPPGEAWAWDQPLRGDLVAGPGARVKESQDNRDKSDPESHLSRWWGEGEPRAKGSPDGARWDEKADPQRSNRYGSADNCGLVWPQRRSTHETS